MIHASKIESFIIALYSFFLLKVLLSEERFNIVMNNKR